MSISATCVKANEVFTLLEEYSFSYDHCWDTVHIAEDGGKHVWNLSNEGDGYYGCTDINGKHVSFLVYE